jgi:RimJ/RimL family protein N-acetyltransferase
VIPARLRQATEADIPAVMAIERSPGYDLLVGRWPEKRHRAEMAVPSNAYLLGLDGDGEPSGFAILRDLDNPHGNVLLQRIAVSRPGQGFGAAFLAALIRWVFARPESHRLWLDVFETNERARRAYRSAGFREDGVLREAYVRLDGRRMNQVLMSLLRPEWEAAQA